MSFAAAPGARDEFVKAHGGDNPERMADQARALRLALNSALVSPDRLKDSLELHVERHRTVPAHLFTAFADTFVATLATRAGVDLPPFVLDATRQVIHRAAMQLSPMGADVESAL